MSATDTSTPSVLEEMVPEKTWREVTVTLIKRQPVGTAGFIVVMIMIAAAIFAEQIAGYNPEANDFGAMLQSPSWDHWFGTDEFGRDIFARIVHGART